MQIKKLHLVNVKVHQDKEFIFNGSTMILGHNGAGKSTIVESIYYALFRELLVPNVDSMINNNIKKVDETTGKVSYLKPAYIELELESDGKVYLIKSPLCKCNGSLKELQDLPDLGPTYVEISNKITDMYSYISSKILHNETAEYFLNTAYTEQMGILNLVSQSEAARQKEFDKIIGITKFANIYDGVTKIYTVANKLRRPDIKELKVKLDNLRVNINNLANDKNALIEEITGLKHTLSDNEIIYNDLQRIQETSNANYTKLNTIYQELYEKNSNYFALKKTVNDDKVNLDNLVKQQEELESMDIPTEEDILMQLEDIQSVVTTITNELNSLKNKEEVLQNEIIRCREDSVRYEKYQNELSKVNLDISSVMSKKNQIDSSLDKLVKEIEPYPQLIEKSKKELFDITNEATETTREYMVILRAYNKNPLVDYEDIVSYFKDIKDIVLDQDKYTCPYCKQTITKKKFKEQLDKDKETFLPLYNKEQQLKDKIKELESVYQNNLAVYQDLQHKENEQKMLFNSLVSQADSLTDYQKNLEFNPVSKPTKSVEELCNEIHDIQNNIESLNSLLSISTLKYENPRIRLMNVDKAKQMSANGRIDGMISEYESLKERFDKYSYQLNNLNSQISFAQNNYTKKLLEISELENRMKDILIINNFKSVNDVYNALVQEQNSLKEVNNELMEKSNNINIAKATLVEKERLLNVIDSNINKDNAEVTDIEKIFRNEEKINNKIRMIDVAKAYFKQDGLAKYVRKYYIDKINERMKDYVGLFNFDFVPVITDTAGIQNYHMYSGGQKIAIAILMKMILNFILNNPINLMILDEPTPYMDTERVEAITDLVTSIKDKLQVIVITHDEEFMKIDCNRIEL